MNEAQLELLETSYKYLLRLSNGVVKEADAWRIEKANDMSNILPIAEGIQYLVKAISLTTTSDSLNETYKSANGVLNSLFEAIQNNDSIFLVDILEYELTPLLDEWKDRLFTILNS